MQAVALINKRKTHTHSLLSHCLNVFIICCFYVSNGKYAQEMTMEELSHHRLRLFTCLQSPSNVLNEMLCPEFKLIIV